MNEEAKKVLTKLLKEERKSLGLTQKELADQLGVSTVHISYLENGTRIPSKKLLKQLYKLGKKDIPPAVLQKLEATKTKISAPLSSPPDTIYELKSQGYYSTKALKQLLKQNPSNLIYIMALFHLYKDMGKLKKAEKLLKDSEKQVKATQDKKWLKAYFYQIQNTQDAYEKALKSMAESLKLFEKEHPFLSESERKMKSELLFRFATIHFDFGVHLFFKHAPLSKKTLIQVKEQFELALKKHQTLRQYYVYPYSQLDYANIHYWLAILEYYQEQDHPREIQLWETFIEESKAAIFLNYQESLKYFPEDNIENSLFSPQFMLLNVSFLALAHGRLALLKKDKPARQHHLEESELIWATHPTKNLLKHQALQYRYFYNFAHFYSIKAQVYSDFSMGTQKDPQVENFLNLCAKAIYYAIEADPASFKLEAQLPSEFRFYKQERADEFNRFLGEKSWSKMSV